MCGRPGGSLGLAVLGTVAWTAAADTARGRSGLGCQHALVTGFDRAFLVAAGLALLLVVAAAAVIRISRAALAGDAPG